MALKDWRKTYSGNNIQRWRNKNYWPEIEISKSYTDINPKKAKTFYLVTRTMKTLIFRDKFKTKKAALNFVKSYMRNN